jgi:hypothetical protein
MDELILNLAPGERVKTHFIRELAHDALVHFIDGMLDLQGESKCTSVSRGSNLLWWILGNALAKFLLAKPHLKPNILWRHAAFNKTINSLTEDLKK